MKILHLGGYRFITESLARAQRDNGHTVSVKDVSSEQSVLTLPDGYPAFMRDASTLLSEKFDIIHLHCVTAQTADSESQLRFAATLSGLIENGARLICQYYRLRFDSPAGQLLHPVHSLARHSFLSSADLLGPVESAGGSWSWLPLGLDLGAFAGCVPQEPAVQEVKVLHISLPAYRYETERIINAVAELRIKNLKFHFKVLDSTDLPTVESLKSAICDSDLFIERVEGTSPGLLAIVAMALGKTVITTSRPEARSAWNAISMCPALDADVKTLSKRLEATIREPRCMRDLSKRVRAYAERIHDGKVITETVLQTYSRLCA